jgi:hypothetical protein
MHVSYNWIAVHVLRTPTETIFDTFGVKLLIIRLFLRSADPQHRRFDSIL